MVLFKSNCIILRPYLIIYAEHIIYSLQRRGNEITASENVYLT